jgi:hypothetical protein
MTIPEKRWCARCGIAERSWPQRKTERSFSKKYAVSICIMKDMRRRLECRGCGRSPMGIMRIPRRCTATRRLAELRGKSKIPTRNSPIKHLLNFSL